MTATHPTESAAPVQPGAVLAGKYRVDRVLGQGGMGVVVEAHHIALDERVALKFLLAEYAKHPEASARFLREARAAVKIKTEHVARVSDVGTLDTGAPYMVMEFLQGADLSKHLETRGTFQVEDAIDYVVQGCEAIAEAHSYGIVHRDIKPANLFLTKRPDGSPLVKVLDFGISKVMSGQGVENLTKTTAAMGSALYMSPEQMQQTKSVDHRTDVYALGISLYELLAGKQPFYADTLPQLCAEILTGTPTPLRSVRADVSDALAAVIEKAYARDRNVRFQSVAELVVALAPFAPARTQPTIERVARLGGLALPAAHTPAPPPSAQPAPASGGTEVFNGPPSNQILPGPYTAPHSTRAKSAFATGASTNAGLVSTQPRKSSSSAPVILAVIGILAAIGIGAGIYMKTRAKPANDSTEQASPPPARDTAAPEPAKTLAPPAATTDQPAQPPSTAQTADASVSSKGAPKPPTRPGGQPVTATPTNVPAAPPPPPPAVPPAAPKPSSAVTSAPAPAKTYNPIDPDQGPR